MVQLAALAAVTERVRVGTSILLLPLYPPAIVAKQVADLDRRSGGRVTLGVGVGGEYPQEFRACGVPVAERGRRTDEAIDLIRRLWTGRPVTHPGPFYAMEDVTILPVPRQPGGPPIVVAGRQPAAMRRAAWRGDGWMPYLYSARRYRRSVTTICSLAEERGRDLTGFGWYAFIFAHAAPDGDRAREETAAFLGRSYSQDFDAMLDSVAAAGTVPEVTAVLQSFVDAGARHLIFLPASRSERTTVVERLMHEVVPALRVPAGEGAEPGRAE
jgi:probable F420-dependent oxidoreductase